MMLKKEGKFNGKNSRTANRLEGCPKRTWRGLRSRSIQTGGGQTRGGKLLRRQVFWGNPEIQAEELRRKKRGSKEETA